MSRSALRLLRLAAFSGAILSAGSVPAFAQSMTTSGDCSSINFQLANPDPGARVEIGTDVISGIALDSRAPSGSVGIDRVDFFLDSRDQGGLSIGTAVPGMTPGPFGPGSFQTNVSMPNLVGGHDLFAYAHDSVTGQESVISEPISLGEDPTKAFVTPPANTATETCTPATGMMSTTTTTTPATTPSTTTTAPAPMTTTTTTAVAPGMSTVTLEVGNPSPGDTIHVGGYVIQGVAFDKAAQSGSGIDTIQIFLDNRDQGGMMLTNASFTQNNMWAATISIPSNQTGLHTLWFYAHSALTGQELAVSVPVTVAP